jgi:hypothetical protein
VLSATFSNISAISWRSVLVVEEAREKHRNTAWVRARFFKLQKGCARLAVASDKVSQLLAHGRWVSLASSTTKTDRHDIAEILLKVALSTKNQSIKSIERMFYVL